MKSTLQLLNRARRHMSGQDIGRFVPNDPGVPGYVAAFGAIIEEGEIALERAHDGLPLYRSFDFCETVNLTRWGKCASQGECWFRVLTCSAHLVARGLGEEAIPLNYSLVTVLVDSFWLEAAGKKDAPIDLLPGVIREARESVERGDGDPFAVHADTAFCVLAELLVSTASEIGRAEALCAELADIHERANQYYLPETYEKNPMYAPRQELVWGLTHFDQLHPDWLVLVAERFPAASSTLQEAKEKLAEAGTRWASRPLTLT